MNSRTRNLFVLAIALGATLWIVVAYRRSTSDAGRQGAAQATNGGATHTPDRTQPASGPSPIVERPAAGDGRAAVDAKAPAADEAVELAAHGMPREKLDAAASALTLELVSRIQLESEVDAPPADPAAPAAADDSAAFADLEARYAGFGRTQFRDAYAVACRALERQQDGSAGNLDPRVGDSLVERLKREVSWLEERAKDKSR